MPATWANNMADPAITPATSICHFLSRLFVAEPDDALLQSCRSGAYAGLLAGWAEQPAMQAGARRLIAALGETDIATLGRAWTLLFSGAGGPATVAPYASAHDGGRLYGAATARMQDVLVRLDLSISPDCHEPADHIAIQLSVLALLLERGDGVAVHAFRRTELAWVPDFCRGCASGDPTGFYQGAVLLLAAVAGYDPAAGSNPAGPASAGHAPAVEADPAASNQRATADRGDVQPC
jgi:TorA-specific chaperone